MKSKDEIISALSKGYEVVQRRHTGDVFLYKDYNSEKSDVSYAVFTELVMSGVIEKTSSMREGHLYFHGPVDFYTLKKTVDRPETLPVPDSRRADIERHKDWVRRHPGRR